MSELSAIANPSSLINLHPTKRWVLDRWLILCIPLGMLPSAFAVFLTMPDSPVAREGLFLGVMSVIWALSALYAVLWRSSYSFDVLPDRVIIHRGIISKRHETILYDTVKEVCVKYGRYTISTPVIVLYLVKPDYRDVIGDYRKLGGQPTGKAEEIAEAIKAYIGQ